MEHAGGGAAAGAALLIGFVGSVHCLGMCGGIAGALGHALPPGRRITTGMLAGLYSLGRIISYTVAGGMVGALGHAFAAGSGLQLVLRAMAGLLMIGIGLHIAGVWNGMALIERAGLGVWRRVLPWTARLGRPDRSWKIFAIGMLWGWLPCGLVYSALVSAGTTGTAQSGAMFMFFFGVGTLPALVFASGLGSTLRALLRGPTTRRAAAAVLAVFGLWTLYGAIGPFLGPISDHRHAPASISMQGWMETKMETESVERERGHAAHPSAARPGRSRPC